MKAGWLLLMLVVAGCSSDPRQQRAIQTLRAAGATVQIDVRGDASSLDLRQCPLTENVRGALADLPRLKSLTVGGNYRDADAGILSGRSSLENLDLSYSGAAGASLAALRTVPGLRFLSLNGLSLSDADLELVAELRSLTSLSLIEATVSDGALERLRMASPRCLIAR